MLFDNEKLSQARAGASSMTLLLLALVSFVAVLWILIAIVRFVVGLTF